jgi:alkyl hydroperoxide reductase subunit AhpC
MFRKIAFILVLILGLAALPQNFSEAYAALGKPAPPFQVESGDNQQLTLDRILGKVVVLFYENRHAVNKNDELKSELNTLYRAQPATIKQEIFPLVVIDCSKASMPTMSLWKSKLFQNSRINGLTIYGDWNRKMLTDYRMQGNDSNFMIIDKQGIIRYSASGQISTGQFQEIKDLLTCLVQDG